MGAGEMTTRVIMLVGDGCHIAEDGHNNNFKIFTDESGWSVMRSICAMIYHDTWYLSFLNGGIS
jgi:hypothetical protein